MLILKGESLAVRGKLVSPVQHVAERDQEQEEKPEPDADVDLVVDHVDGQDAEAIKLLDGS